MDTVVALLRAVARALRRLFDMALMAVGVAPTSIPVTDAALLPLDIGANGSGPDQCRGPYDLSSPETAEAPIGSVFNAWVFRQEGPFVRGNEDL